MATKSVYTYLFKFHLTQVNLKQPKRKFSYVHQQKSQKNAMSRIGKEKGMAARSGNGKVSPNVWRDANEFNY